uniref:Uncharacterized protein n=1 Tax=Globisporangium ultimum (strain ATCC 200006 / CBS 805.95 / DAOM BR144) TaxID=431595 RepID=K3WCM0_GLOUD
MTIVKPFTIEVHPEQENDDLHGLPELPLPFLHVDGRFKMFELRKYITRRLNLEKLAEDLEITCLGAIVGPELSVHFIYRTIWQHRYARRPLMLHYRHLTP